MSVVASQENVDGGLEFGDLGVVNRGRWGRRRLGGVRKNSRLIDRSCTRDNGSNGRSRVQNGLTVSNPGHGFVKSNAARVTRVFDA